MAGASEALKITHLDLGSGEKAFLVGKAESWAKLGASGAEAWARFPAPDRFGTGLGCGIIWWQGLPKVAAFKIRLLCLDD